MNCSSVITVRALTKNRVMPMCQGDQGDGEEPGQQVLENGCVCNYNGGNLSKMHCEHLNQGEVCGQVYVSMYMIDYLSIFRN